jgi:MazG family protein
MKEFEELVEVAEKLNGPDGCPWDWKQNFFSLQPYVLEESYELLEAVDEGDNRKIIEELGDYLYVAIFYCQIAQKEARFTLKEVLKRLKEKLVYRHPHVFGKNKLDKEEEIVQQWEALKKEEMTHRKSLLDGIPKGFPTLNRAQKILQKLNRKASAFLPDVPEEKVTEEEMGEQLLGLLVQAEHQGIDIESVLRRRINKLEEAFRKSES